MAGQRRGPGRGTRMGKGTLSGSTIVTAPSGVTIGKACGVQTDDGYCPTYTTAGYKWRYGTADVASNGVDRGTGAVSNILYIDTGLTNIYGFWPTIYSDVVGDTILSGSAVSPVITSYFSGGGATVQSFDIRDSSGCTPVKLFYKGVSCVWLAFGT